MANPNPNVATRFQPGNDVGINTRWPCNQSGNPAGSSKLRRQFQEALYQALIGQGSAEEVAVILWKAARKGEAWGVQMLLQYLAPQKMQLELSREDERDEVDYSKFTIEELKAMEAIMERASARQITGGDVPPESA